MEEDVIKLEKITKQFPLVLANDNISLTVKKGEVFAIVGENGAGKTTLMNILYGIHTPTSGKIYINNKEIFISNPSVAILHGIGMVHQHFMLVPPLTVAENIVLGEEPRKNKFVLDIKKAIKETEELTKKFGLFVDPAAIVEQLPVGIQQRVEILKALKRGAEILILDEPTAVLTPQEIADLFETINFLKKAGKTIIFISHKLKEVLTIADRIAVLRRGKLIDIVNKNETNQSELAKMMVGREVFLKVDKIKTKIEESALTINDLHIKNDKGILSVKGVSFDVRKGEILGIAGVEGNGQKELTEAIVGLRKVEKGEIYISSELVNNTNPSIVRRAGLSYIPEDRRKRGLVLPFTVSYNIILGKEDDKRFASYWSLDERKISEFSDKVIEEYDIRPPEGGVVAKTLSGGNQQKVILAREIYFDHFLMVASQPTRGLDVGAMEFVYSKLIEEKSRGRGVLLISFEIDEILSLSDRILVLYNGKIVGELDPAKTTEHELGYLMLGGKH